MVEEDIKRDYIVVKHGKGNKERVVPKSPTLSKQLLKYLYVRESYFNGKETANKNLFLSKTGKPLTDEVVARMLEQQQRLEFRSLFVLVRTLAAIPSHKCS